MLLCFEVKPLLIGGKKMKIIRPSGVQFTICDVQSNACTAKKIPTPVSIIFEGSSSRQINVCAVCLKMKVDSGEWEIEGYVKRK